MTLSSGSNSRSHLSIQLEVTPWWHEYGSGLTKDERARAMAEMWKLLAAAEEDRLWPVRVEVLSCEAIVLHFAVPRGMDVEYVREKGEALLRSFNEIVVKDVSKACLRWRGEEYFKEAP